MKNKYVVTSKILNLVNLNLDPKPIILTNRNKTKLNGNRESNNIRLTLFNLSIKI